MIDNQTLGKDHEREAKVEQTMEEPDDDRVGENVHEQSARQDEKSASEEARPERIRADVRKLMQCVAHPVVVLTAAATMPATQQPVPLGIAVSSFNTVTLNPPTISFNIKQPSQTLDAIRADRGRFRIHFFASRPNGAQLVDSFTKGNNPTAYNDRLKLAQMDFSGKSLNGSDHFSTAASMQGPGVSAAMECELTQELAVGDHIIAVATVSNVQIKEKKAKPYLSYVQHNYVQMPHNILRRHTEMDLKGGRIAASNDLANHIFWGLPMFPTEAHRFQLREKLVDYVRNVPGLLDMSVPDAKRHICVNLDIPQEPLGVPVKDVLLYTAREQNSKVGDKPSESEIHSLPEFYGPLSLRDITTINERAKAFVRNDALFLDLHFETLLGFLSISSQSSGLLACDIMGALRTEGLVRPFGPSIEGFNSQQKFITPTLERLEQVEYSLRQHMKSRDPLDMNSISPEKLAYAIGGSGWVVAWIKQVRPRIHVEAFPEFHPPDKYDFAGHLTPQECRVATMRILSFLDRPEARSQSSMTIQWHRVLMSCRIHPLVSGFNFIEFIAKLRFWHRNSPYDEYKRIVGNMVDSNFISRVDMQELDERANELVKTAVIRAIEMTADEKSDDLLAALGLQTNCSITISEGRWLKLDSPSLRRILRDAIEKNYDQYAENEKVMVDGFLAQAKDEQLLIHRRNSKQDMVTPGLRGQEDSSQDMARALKLEQGQMRLKGLRRTEEAKERDKKNKAKFKGFTAYGLRGNVKTDP
jgi:flavin reductase (DIM6/NTAB) family NADH-FMN oxidoreductase RutF